MVSMSSWSGEYDGCLRHHTACRPQLQFRSIWRRLVPSASGIAWPCSSATPFIGTRQIVFPHLPRQRLPGNAQYSGCLGEIALHEHQNVLDMPAFKMFYCQPEIVRMCWLCLLLPIVCFPVSASSHNSYPLLLMGVTFSAHSSICSYSNRYARSTE
jgi:hypothetical protein